MTNRILSSGPPAPLSPKVAFIVHLIGTESSDGAITGRVEHVTSGCSLRFTSIDQLAVFMAHTVARQESAA